MPDVVVLSSIEKQAEEQTTKQHLFMASALDLASRSLPRLSSWPGLL